MADEAERGYGNGNKNMVGTRDRLEVEREGNTVSKGYLKVDHSRFIPLDC